MENVTPFQESDIPSHELICQETDSQWSQVTVANKIEPSPSPQEEDASISESNGIPEVPGRHRITTCKDVGFFATASTTHEAILSSSSETQLSNASASTQADYAAVAGTEKHSSSHLMPVKNAARVSDLFRSGTEGNSEKGRISTLDGRESGISLNESLLLSVDLTSADLGTICDVNDKNYYRQMVLRSLLNAGEADQCDSERRDIPVAEASLNDDQDVEQEVNDIGSGTVVSSLVEDSTCYDLAQVCGQSDERTGKFRVVQLDSSSQEVFEDAAGSQAKNSGESLPSFTTADTSISVEETTAEDVQATTLQVVGDGDSEKTEERSFTDMLPIDESNNTIDNGSEIDMNQQKYDSEDRSIATVEESKTVELPTAFETGSLMYRSRSDNTLHRLEKDDRNLKNRSMMLLDALLRAGTENTVATAVRGGFCFTAVFILLYAPSTILNILTLYLQLLVCAIFVDIFLN